MNVRSLIRLLILFLALHGSVAAQEDGKPAEPSLNQLAWLAGSWTGKQGTSDVEEHWLPPKGGIMLGVNRTVGSSGKSSFEFLRIAADGGQFAYYASPGGGAATTFKLSKLAEKRVVFENPTHDFPQRIIYERTGDKLKARIEGTIGGKDRFMEWEWTRSSPAGSKGLTPP